MKKLFKICATIAAFTATNTALAEDPYISTTGNHGNTGESHFIDTAWTITAKTRVELDYALLEDWNTSWGSSYLFGGSGQTPWFTAFVQSGNIGFHNGSGWKEIRTSGVNSADMRFTAILDNANDTASLLSGGVTVGSVATAHQTTYGSATLKIASHAFGTNNFAAIKIYGIRIYEDGTKMRDYSPLVKGGVAGFRDSVTGTFLSGVALTASANTPEEDDDPYLATDGVSTYVDTLWAVTPQTRFELDYALIDDYTGTASIYLFGGSGQTPSWFTSFIRFDGIGFANGVNGNDANWKTKHLGNLGLVKDIRHTVVIDNANGWVGTLLAGVTNSYSAATSAASFQSGTIKIASHVNVQNFSAIKIYGYRIFEGGVKVHDYTPMRKGGQLGFKDSVTGAFFADQHTVQLTAGGNMPEEPEDGYVATPAANSAIYINTEYYATENTRFELDYAPLSVRSGTWYLFNGYTRLCAYMYGSGIGFGVGKNGTASEWSSRGLGGSSVSDAVGIRRTVSMDNVNNMCVVQTAGITNDYLALTYTGKYTKYCPIYIGAAASSIDKPKDVGNFASIKVYGCRIYESGSLVRNFVPYAFGPKQSGSVLVGLKDTITGVFVTYPNATDESRLVCGGEIAMEPPYVETLRSGKRYIDTGYTVTANTKIELDYAQTEARAANDTWYFFATKGSGNWFAAYINKNAFGFINSGSTWKQSVGASLTNNAVNVRRTILLDNPAGLGVIATYGVTNATCETTAASSYSGNTLKIATTENASDHFASIRIYGCKIWEKENGEYVLKRDYLPAVVNGVAGLQDILPGGEFKPGATSASSPVTYGGVFPVEVSQSTGKISHGHTATLSASALGATSYRWLKNGEPIEGGTSGTLTVNWRKPKNTPIDTYQAVAVYTIDTATGESEPSAEMTVENLPAGMCVIVK